jgi:hypothetical protein
MDLNPHSEKGRNQISIYQNSWIRICVELHPIQNTSMNKTQKALLLASVVDPDPVGS